MVTVALVVVAGLVVAALVVASGGATSRRTAPAPRTRLVGRPVARVGARPARATVVERRVVD